MPITSEQWLQRTGSLMVGISAVDGMAGNSGMPQIAGEITRIGGADSRLDNRWDARVVLYRRNLRLEERAPRPGEGLVTAPAGG